MLGPILSNTLLLAIFIDFLALLLLKVLYEADQRIKVTPQNPKGEATSKALFVASLLVASTALTFTIYSALISL